MKSFIIVLFTRYLGDQSIRMKWAGYVACIREMYMKFWLENLKGRDHLEDLSVDGRNRIGTSGRLL
jgi:hypothetical protein